LGREDCKLAGGGRELAITVAAKNLVCRKGSRNCNFAVKVTIQISGITGARQTIRSLHCLLARVSNPSFNKMAEASSQNDQPLPSDEPEDSFLDPNEAAEEFAHDDSADDHPMSDDDDGEPMAEDEDANEELIVDDSIQGFFLHTSPVYSVALHENWAATGGGDDLGYVWDVRNGEMIMKLDGHTDSVTNVGFSSDGKFLATGGMDGQVRIWSVAEKKLLVALEGGTEVMVR